ncbi:MAG: hypothetical protein WCK98_07890 [bacterium]
MAFTNFNPPFTNKDLQDFFDFECDNQYKAVFLQNWIGDNFPDLDCKLAYHVPFYWLGKNKVFYFHYFEINEVLELEISFVKGDLIQDRFGLFQAKNKQTKAIIITSIEEEFLSKIQSYINQAIKLS